MLLVFIAAAIAAFTTAAWLARQIWLEARASTQRFGLVCPICRYHQHGVDHGFVNVGEQVELHDCPEARHG